ncbi:hypothetical protein LUI11_32570 [Bradyrhizobium diazoefficiens]|uniref:Uncharacterized protein n=2 Tax=Bradyrhizobium diazoefficiens TaxID=1355477 RepID=A0A809Z469_9BRAD|nr:hypothetical protein [Bradyrhizobium diazoefficiens]KGJ66019.1 hypothetical protein BJA5080_02666 [Bradyrhizobium diazoefficiens SEMIA 5080]BAL13531.1 hypothetical protein BJ6T_82880 [Bradyrhizobium japonicum USDA 6]GEC47254.1 hypothetical protein BJA01nite_48960 [Bradyrhizobium japonicum]AND87212.1 hypothetical protein AAV28_04750 [Bradyrhizobium diazoefficiens USDA 110]APO50187.1 hypothetical protein BD122_08125 [Bradyrhizobium diazoefficiens]
MRTYRSEVTDFAAQYQAMSTRLMLLDVAHRPASATALRLMRAKLDVIEEALQRQSILLAQKLANLSKTPAHADP